jgi:hypothetical protein
MRWFDRTLDLLRPDPAEADVARRASDAPLRLLLLVEAVVAGEPGAPPVEGEGDGARRAVPDVAAVAALNEVRVAPPVQQEDGLLAAREPVSNGLLQLGGEDEPRLGGARLLPLALPLRPQVHHARGGEGLARGAIGELEEAVLARERVLPALQRGRRRAEHADRAGGASPHDRGVPGVIAGCLRLLVGALVLLVHHDGAELRQGREHGRPRSDRDPLLAGA